MLLRSTATILIVMLCACQDPMKEQRRKLASEQASQANEALKHGELQRALFAAELAAQYDPMDPSMRDLAMRVSLAQIAAFRPSLSLEQFGRSAYQAEMLAARDPENAAIYETVRAIDAFARGDPAGAEKRLRDVTTATPSYYPAWLMLGDLLQANHRPKEALDAFQNAEALSKRNPRAVSNIGMLHAQLGDAKRAVEKLTEALALEDTAAVRATLANAYLMLDRPMDALPHFARAAKLEPRDGRYRVSLGETHLKLEQLAEAEAAFRDATVLGAEPWASRGQGAVAMKKKDYAAAMVAFSRVLAMTPDEPSTLFFAAEAQERLTHPADAAKLYARFAELGDRLPAEAARVLLARDRMTRLSPAPK